MKKAIILISIVVLFSITSVMIAYSQDDVETLVKKGVDSHNLGLPPELALPYFDKALEIDPNHVKALTNKGGILSILGKHEDAISYFDRALEIEPNNVDALANKGSALGSLGEFDDAMLYLDRVLEIEPNNTSALNNKAGLYLDQRNYYDAVLYFHKVLKIDPRNAIAREYIPFIKDALGFVSVKGFIDFILRDSQGNLIGYYKSPYLGVLGHEISRDFINSWNVTDTVNYNGTNYEVRQKLYQVTMDTEGVFATSRIPGNYDPDLTMVLTGTWGYPVNRGDVITTLYTIFKPI